MALGGAAHFLVPRGYATIVPRVLGDPLPWVYGSGVAELACAALLMSRRTRNLGGWATAALLVGVFPANANMALLGGIDGAGFPLDNAAVAWLRLPLQVPLVWWAYRQTNAARRRP